MVLSALDWIIVVLSLCICFLPALFFGKRASENTTEYFASGRSVPWWLAGLSMVATTFSADTPNLVTDIIRKQGVAGNWQWWAFTLTGMATVFFYARLWRRSAVLTDLEFYEIRYSGRAASAVRGFRAVYLGLCFNCLIMATVNLAICKIAGILFGLKMWQTLLGTGLLNVSFAAFSGLWGVLVIDMIQFFLKMTAVIAAAYFALIQPEVGGLHGLVTKLSDASHGINYLNLLPDFSNDWNMAVSVFVMPLAVQWWAVWYPGCEPGGGSFIAQRMLAAKSEKDSLGAVLFFNLAHYVLRPWPWILVALASVIVYPHLSDIQAAYPNLDPQLLGDDIAYPAMLRFLPVGFAGLMVGGLIAASSSTFLTLLNWGASYLVHDFYRRFIWKTGDEKHYVLMGRLATILLFACSSLLTLVLGTAKSAFDIILLVGAGTGLLYLVRWFWWRVNAWCEIVAMLSSFAVSAYWFWYNNHGGTLNSAAQLLITVALTTISWLLAAYLAPATEMSVLINFFHRVRPAGPGWNRIRRRPEISQAEASSHEDHIPMALLGWVAGCTMVWSAIFTLGNFLYGRTTLAIFLFVIFVLSTSLVIYAVNRLWSNGKTDRTATIPRTP